MLTGVLYAEVGGRCVGSNEATMKDWLSPVMLWKRCLDVSKILANA